VAIGLVFALVGAGLIASFYFSATSNPASTQSSSVFFHVPENETQLVTFPAIGTGSAALTIGWNSSGPSNVSFSQAISCAVGYGICPATPYLASWPSADRGTWSGSGSAADTYLLLLAGIGHAINFSATLRESYAATAFGLPTTTWILLIIASILLLGTGAVGVFLGLFLRSNVYAGDGELDPADYPHIDPQRWDEADDAEADDEPEPPTA
jgi:hypothetical protein